MPAAPLHAVAHAAPPPSRLPRHRRWLRMALPPLLLWFCLAGPAGALPPPQEIPDPVLALQNQLAEEQAALSREQSTLQTRQGEVAQRLLTLEQEGVPFTLVEQARLGREGASLRRDDLTIEKQRTANLIAQLEERIREAERLLASQPKGNGSAGEPPQQQLQQQVQTDRALLTLHRQRQEVLTRALAAAEAALTQAGNWEQSLMRLHQSAQERSRQEALEDLNARLRKERERWQQQAARVHGELERLAPDDATSRLVLEARQLEAEERLRLLPLEEGLAKALMMLAKSDPENLDPEAPVGRLVELRGQLEATSQELAANDTLIQRKLDILQRQLALAVKQSAEGSDRNRWKERRKVLQGLVKVHEEYAERLAGHRRAFQSRMEEVSALLKERQRQGLFTRVPLPDQWGQWQALGVEAAELPLRYGERIVAAIGAWDARLSRLPAGGWLAIFLGWGAWLGGGIWLRRRLGERLARAAEPPPEEGEEGEASAPPPSVPSDVEAPPTAGEETAPAETAATVEGNEPLPADASYSHKLAFRLMALVHRNLPPFLAAGVLLLPALLAELPLPTLLLLFLPPLLLLNLMLALDLAHLLLAATVVESGRPAVRLQRQVRLLLLTGGVLGTLLWLIHLLAPSPPLLDLVQRLFMLFLLVTVPLLTAVRGLMLARLAQQQAGRFRWLPLVRQFTLLAPLALVVAGALGLVGFVNLGWSVGQGLLWLLVVVAGWSILNNLLGDLAAAAKNYANLHSGNGLLWSQGIIAPLHRLARLGLLLATPFAFLSLMGWDPHSAPVQWLLGVLDLPLFSVGETALHLKDLIITLAILVGVVWLGKWAREVSYRWLLAGIEDLGIRNSLSVFFHYALVLIGILVALRVAGVELTNLAIIAGALGVGIGFGLQNIANNFVSGILLLIERPLRTGDLVQVSGSEGEVTHIGIRSLTVRTYDNQEVIIPNSEVISSPFVNWTHRDPIIRTNLLMGVSYDDDPHLVKRVLLEIVSNHPGVLKEPAPAVRLTEFADSSVNFRVFYYTNMRTHNRMEILSEVLFAIWDRFKRENITIPYPQRDIHIRTTPPGAALPGTN